MKYDAPTSYINSHFTVLGYSTKDFIPCHFYLLQLPQFMSKNSERVLGLGLNNETKLYFVIMICNTINDKNLYIQRFITPFSTRVLFQHYFTRFLLNSTTPLYLLTTVSKLSFYRVVLRFYCTW